MTNAGRCDRSNNVGYWQSVQNPAYRNSAYIIKAENELLWRQNLSKYIHFPLFLFFNSSLAIIMTKNRIIQILLSLWEDVTTKRVMNSASMLTYSTLLAIVPVAAVIFAIARGFGYNKYFETWFRNSFTGNEQVTEIILGFVNSYLVHTQSGVFFGIGLVFMLYTILMLTRNIEQVFNDIWNVHKQRDFFRSLTDYLAMFFILPILIIVVSGLTTWVASFVSIVNETFVIGTLLKITINIIPFVVMVGIITLIYTFLPNTRVKWLNAFIPAIVSSLALELLQQFYIHSQMWVSGYNAIYGSFAALPLFMLWLQFTWTIILFGAELSYTMQNVEEFRSNRNSKIATRYRHLLCTIIMSRVCRRFYEGKHPYSISELKAETKIPMRVLNELIFDLMEAKLLIEGQTSSNNSSLYPENSLLPGETVENITVGTLLSRLDSLYPWITERDFDVRDIMKSESWTKALKLRNKYLEDQKKIKLYELV